MIALLRGEVALRRDDHVVIMCAGVGYRLSVSTQTLRRVPAVGEEITLHAHLIAHEDAMTLYGFVTEQERELFLMLLGVQSVGPKVALAVLSGGTSSELVGALAAGDVARFQAVKGIGRRTAERIIVELREKVGAADADIAGPIVVRRGDDPRALAGDALLELGYAPTEVEDLLAGAQGASAEELLAHALRGARAA